MADEDELTTVDRAIELIDAVSVRPRLEERILWEARGMRLAGEIRADRDFPHFQKSLMDGFALADGNVAAGTQYRIIGEVAAGKMADRPVGKGEAYRIMTGAPMPVGAGGVVPVEMVKNIADDQIVVTAAVECRRFVADRGSDVRQGVLVLERGVMLGPAQLASAAAVGAWRCQVYARPRVGVLVSGDEIVEGAADPVGAQIRNSNGIMLLALLERMGCEPIDLGLVRDDRALIRRRMEQGLEQCDVLFVTGGMSMGAYDFVPGLLDEMGFALRVRKLKIKPGKPFVFAQKNEAHAEGTDRDITGQYVLGLPGNPVSAFVCAARLGGRLVRRMAGGTAEGNWITGKLAEKLGPNGVREFYQPVLYRDGEIFPLGWKGSADIFALARSNALLRRAAGEPAQTAGSTARVLEI